LGVAKDDKLSKDAEQAGEFRTPLVRQGGGVTDEVGPVTIVL
jgi:hypothetical protein